MTRAGAPDFLTCLPNFVAADTRARRGQWGQEDPWIVPRKADLIQAAKPSVERINLVSGHCPHDDTPEEFNEALIQWVKKLS